MTTDNTNLDAHGWREVADRVFQRRYQPGDVTVTVIVGGDGLAVVDTRCNLAEARELRADLRRLSTAPVRWVVNTHAHFDHVWGNAEFSAPRQVPPAEIWGHHTVPVAMTAPRLADLKKRLAAESPEWEAHLAELEEVAPDHLVDLTQTIDLGDRSVELRFAGRGHTDGDLLVRIPDADALLAGDLVEESGAPYFGPDSYPLDWAPTLDVLLGWCGPDTVIVPGHGAAVGPAFVKAQQAEIRAVGEQAVSLHGAGVPVTEALAAGAWPYETRLLADAVARAYEQLGS